MKKPTYLLAFIDFDFPLTDVLGELLQGRQKELGKWLRLSWHRRQRHGHPDYLFDAFGICWFQMLDEGVVVLEAGWALFFSNLGTGLLDEEAADLLRHELYDGLEQLGLFKRLGLLEQIQNWCPAFQDIVKAGDVRCLIVRDDLLSHFWKSCEPTRGLLDLCRRVKALGVDAPEEHAHSVQPQAWEKIEQVLEKLLADVVILENGIRWIALDYLHKQSENRCRFFRIGLKLHHQLRDYLFRAERLDLGWDLLRCYFWRLRKLHHHLVLPRAQPQLIQPNALRQTFRQRFRSLAIQELHNRELENLQQRWILEKRERFINGLIFDDQFLTLHLNCLWRLFSFTVLLSLYNNI